MPQLFFIVYLDDDGRGLINFFRRFYKRRGYLIYPIACTYTIGKFKKSI